MRVSVVIPAYNRAARIEATVPTVAGTGLRALLYRLILRMDGVVAIETGARIRFASNIRLGRGVNSDNGVHLHARPNGIKIGEETFVMRQAELHVYNFRRIPRD